MHVVGRYQNFDGVPHRKYCVYTLCQVTLSPSPLLLLILDLLLEEDGVLQEVGGVGHPPGGLPLAGAHHAQSILGLHVSRAQLGPEEIGDGQIRL